MNEQTQTRLFFWGMVLIPYVVLFSILNFTNKPAKVRILAGLFTLSLLAIPVLIMPDLMLNDSGEFDNVQSAVLLNRFLYPLIVFILLKKNGGSINWRSLLFPPAMFFV